MLRVLASPIRAAPSALFCNNVSPAPSKRYRYLPIASAAAAVVGLSAGTRALSTRRPVPSPRVAAATSVKPTLSASSAVVRPAEPRREQSSLGDLNLGYVLALAATGLIIFSAVDDVRSLSAAKRELAERWARPLTDADFGEAFGPASTEVSVSSAAPSLTALSSTAHESGLCESDRRLLDRLQHEFSSPCAAIGTQAHAARSGLNASASWFGSWFCSWFGAPTHSKDKATDAQKGECDDAIILEIARLLVPVGFLPGFLPTKQSPETNRKLNLPFRPLTVIAANDNSTTESRRRQHDILRRACILASHVAVSSPVLGSASSEPLSSSSASISSLPTRGYVAFAHCPRPDQHSALPASAAVTDTASGSGTDTPIAPAPATAADTEYLNDAFHRDMTQRVRLALFAREWQGRLRNAGAVGANSLSSSMLGWFSPLSTAATNATASSDSDAVTASLSAASVASALSAASSSPSSAASSSGARAGRKITADVQSDLRQMIFWISSAALLLVDVQDDAEKSSDSPPSAPTSDLPRAVNLPRTKTPICLDRSTPSVRSLATRPPRVPVIVLDARSSPAPSSYVPTSSPSPPTPLPTLPISSPTPVDAAVALYWTHVARHSVEAAAGGYYRAALVLDDRQSLDALRAFSKQNPGACVFVDL